ncbi:unnamed protein product [marine sediment metagenome]|uniref:Uncharacterized protein n=1 Tax=marine sediment metagenome TaxID=412755 RepID=X0UJ86_9ZZZZ
MKHFKNIEISVRNRIGCNLLKNPIIVYIYKKNKKMKVFLS